jgi:predicted O-methyltransferase YrrM
LTWRDTHEDKAGSAVVDVLIMSKGRQELKFAVLNLPCSNGSLHYSCSRAKFLGHPIYAWLGMRPVLAQHTAEEHMALQRWAKDHSSIVEIGVAEGVSSLALRQGMAADGTLYLIDPFHLSRVPAFNFTKRTAHRAVESCDRGRVVWIEQFSSDAIQTWNNPIDLLLIDGDHTEDGVRRDWNEWSCFIVPGGIVIFHDARVFEGAWTSPDYGPVRFVNDFFRQQLIPDWKIVEEVHSLVVLKRLR